MNYVQHHDDFAFEPARGLPALLPKGEHIVWQGAPSWRSFAQQVFHTRAIMAFVAIMATWQIASGLFDGLALGAAFGEATVVVTFGAVGLGILWLMAWLVERTTVYTITNRRVLMRVGVAIEKTFNVPFAQIDGAALRDHGDGTGSLALQLKPGVSIAYLLLWPHARPWRMGRTEPMLRAVPDAQGVAELLTAVYATEAKLYEARQKAKAGMPEDVEPAEVADKPKRAEGFIHDSSRVARRPLMAVASLPVVALLIVAFVQWGGGNAVTEAMDEALAEGQAGLWQLSFEDAGEGRLAVMELGSGEEIAVLPAGSEGLLRGALRGLGHSRRMSDLDMNAPYQLIAWETGRITLSDDLTGRHIPLNSFGPFESGAIADVLALANSALEDEVTASVTN